MKCRRAIGLICVRLRVREGAAAVFVLAGAYAGSVWPNIEAGGGSTTIALSNVMSYFGFLRGRRRGNRDRPPDGTRAAGGARRLKGGIICVTPQAAAR